MLGPRWEFLAWNAAQARLYPRIVELQGLQRNLLWVLFADPFTRPGDHVDHPRVHGCLDEGSL